MDDLENFWLKLPFGYRRNAANTYYDDVQLTTNEVWQPEVYSLAQHLLDRGNFKCVVDIGSGNGTKLNAIRFQERKIGIDFGTNFSNAKQQQRNIEWIDRNLNESIAEIEFPENTLFICSDVIEHLENPSALLESMRILSRIPGATIVISTPDRDRARGLEDIGPPANKAHCQEWNFMEFRSLLEQYQIPVVQHGHTRNFSGSSTRNTQVVISDHRFVYLDSSKSTFNVAAIMPVFNEVDIVKKSVSRLLSQGIDVYVIDNWSDDGSYEILLEMSYVNNKIKIERFPSEPVCEYMWSDILNRMEELSLELDYDWFIHVDADEFLEGYSSYISLKDCIKIADHSGYDVIDFTLLDFRPTSPIPEAETHLPNRWEFSTRGGAKYLQRAWKNNGVRPDFHKSGGHFLTTHQRMFPFNFLIMHFPIRNEMQAHRKIFRDRLPRFKTERANLGWHTQYDGYTKEDHFVWDESNLQCLELGLQSEYLPEILGRCNIFPPEKN